MLPSREIQLHANNGLLKWKGVERIMKLIDFVEQFVAHNTDVEIYSLELVPEKITDTITRYCKKFNKLETVMDWQITEPDDCAYYKAHPDVKPSKYRYHNVEMIVGVPNHIDRMDLVGIVVEVQKNDKTKRNTTFTR